MRLLKKQKKLAIIGQKKGVVTEALYEYIQRRKQADPDRRKISRDKCLGGYSKLLMLN